MKFKSVISLTIINSLLLFVFGSLLASCNKKTLPKTGYFTKIQTPSRSIASSAPEQVELYKEYQDPKQIIIFCSLSSHNYKHCYNKQLKESVSEYIRRTKDLQADASIAIIKFYNFDKVNSQINDQVLHVKSKIDTSVLKLVTRQKKFCKQNSVKNVDRCLKQFKNRDSIAVLNKFQYGNQLNGHEYLYVKNLIEKEYEKKSKQAKLDI